eukprot:gene1634-3168_t
MFCFTKKNIVRTSLSDILLHKPKALRVSVQWIDHIKSPKEFFFMKTACMKFQQNNIMSDSTSIEAESSVIGLLECIDLLQDTDDEYNPLTVSKAFYEAATAHFETRENKKLFRVNNESPYLERFSANDRSYVGIADEGERCNSLSEWFHKNVEQDLLMKRSNISGNTLHKPSKECLSLVLSGGYDYSLVVSIPEFRPFISSTFTDTAYERDLMILLVYPFLSEYARVSGVSFFQPSEMRWGIGPALSGKHMTSEVCLSELKRCQLSQGLSYVLILGDKYGSRFPRARIATDEFISLRKVVDSDDIPLLDSWYVLDTNHNEYALRFLDNEDLTKRFWSGEATRLHQILCHAAQQVFTSPSDPRRSLYAISITHEEALVGIHSVEPSRREHSVAVIIRNLDGIDEQDPATMRNWIDVCTNQSATGGVEPSTNIMINTRKALWMEKATLFTGHPNQQNKSCSNFDVTAYTIPCTRSGLDMTNAAHRTYFRHFLRHISDLMTQSIDRISTGGSLHHYCATDIPFSEAVSHNRFALEKCSVFVHTPFTKMCVDRMLKFVSRTIDLSAASGSGALSEPPTSSSLSLSSISCPYFVVIGKSGTGKTSLMATAVQAIRDRWPEVNVIARFLGTTRNSTDIIPMLQTLVAHIIRLYPDIDFGVNDSSDYKELCSQFEHVLTLIPSSKPLVIILDSLDQLSVMNRSRRLAFLPRTMTNTAAVRILLSTLPEPEFEVWPRLVAMYAPTGPPSVEVPPWTPEDGAHVLNAILTKNQFTLTTGQRTHVLDKFNQCPSSLFLMLTTFISRDWKSSDTIGTGTGTESVGELASDVRGCIFQIYDKLARDHGRVLFTNVLALITVAEGLGFDELLHLLSLNDEVLDEVFQWWTPPIRRLPPLLLTRILSELDPFLVRRVSYGVEEIFWYHRQLWTAARQYALPNIEEEQKYHRQIVEFYTGKWYKVPKPYKSKGKSSDVSPFLEAVMGTSGRTNGRSHRSVDDNVENGDILEADRLVPAQPWIHSGVPNKRKLWMLPSNAIRAHDWTAARDALCTIGAMECAAASGMSEELKAMYREANRYGESALKTLRDGLEASDNGPIFVEEIRLIESFLVDVNGFESYLRSRVDALDDSAFVLQFALNTPLNTPVRNAAAAFYDELIASSMTHSRISNNINQTSSVERSLVISQNLPEQSDILSRVAIPGGSSESFSHVHFGDGDVVMAAVADVISGRIIVYNMVLASIAFDYKVPFECLAVRWSPSGRSISSVGKNGKMHITVIADDYDGVMSCTTIDLQFPPVNGDGEFSVCLAWTDEEHVVIGMAARDRANNAETSHGIVRAVRHRASSGRPCHVSRDEQGDGAELIMDPSDDILSQITCFSSGTSSSGRHIMISPQGKYLVTGMAYETLSVTPLRGASKGSVFFMELKDCRSSGGGGSLTSLAFSLLGQLLVSMRGNIVIYSLGHSLSQCSVVKQACRAGEYNEIPGKTIHNWTNFVTCTPSPSSDLLLVGDHAGSIWLLKNESEDILDQSLLSCHSSSPIMIQIDESMKYMVSMATKELFLWNFTHILLPLENKLISGKHIVFSPMKLFNSVDSICRHLWTGTATNASTQNKLISEEHTGFSPVKLFNSVDSICWHPDGSHFIVTCSQQLVAYDGCTGAQIASVNGVDNLPYVIFDKDLEAFIIPYYWLTSSWNVRDKKVVKMQHYTKVFTTKYTFMSKKYLAASATKRIGVRMQGYDYPDDPGGEILSSGGYSPKTKPIPTTCGVALQFFKLPDSVEMASESSSTLPFTAPVTTGPLMFTIDLPEALAVQGGGVAIERDSNPICTNIKFIAMDIDITADLSMIAVPGMGGQTVLFYELLWSSDNASATAKLLRHRFEASSRVTAVRFCPISNRAGDSPVISIAISTVCGEVSVVQIRL